MVRGGPRNRSGPPADPSSERSENRGLTYKLLPREGFVGKPPKFPLPQPSTRERAMWRSLWKTPQAAMWDAEPWRVYVVGMYCRWAVRAEGPDATAALVTQVHRLGDQIGLTPAGMKENGWRLAIDELGTKRTAQAPAPLPAGQTPAPVRRLRAPITPS
jgi:hypothetical protein